eukprot:Gb_27699 [translate_table: standard]
MFVNAVSAGLCFDKILEGRREDGDRVCEARNRCVIGASLVGVEKPTTVSHRLRRMWDEGILFKDVGEVPHMTSSMAAGEVFATRGVEMDGNEGKGTGEVLVGSDVAK